MVSQLKPKGASRAVINAWHPPSAGVGEGMLSNCSVSLRVAWVSREGIKFSRHG
jgi:hypothetical protein